MSRPRINQCQGKHWVWVWQPGVNEEPQEMGRAGVTNGRGDRGPGSGMEARTSAPSPGSVLRLC